MHLQFVEGEAQGAHPTECRLSVRVRCVIDNESGAAVMTVTAVDNAKWFENRLNVMAFAALVLVVFWICRLCRCRYYNFQWVRAERLVWHFCDVKTACARRERVCQRHHNADDRNIISFSVHTHTHLFADLRRAGRRALARADRRPSGHWSRSRCFNLLKMCECRAMLSAQTTRSRSLLSK